MPSEVVETLEALYAFANRFLDAHPEGGVFGLEGALAAGKTTFVRAVIQAVANRSGKTPPRVISPTYPIHQFYDGNPTVDHFDLYRLENPTSADLLETGYFEALERAQSNRGFVFVEWPERLPRAQAISQVLRFKQSQPREVFF